MNFLDVAVVGLGGGLVAGAGYLLSRKPGGVAVTTEPDVKRVSLERLAEEFWLKPAEAHETKRDGEGAPDIYRLRDYWREPSGRFARGYAPPWKHTLTGDFFADYLAAEEQLAKAPYYRGVIIHLLELLDREHPVPSVITPIKAIGQEANATPNPVGYDEHKFAALKNITLLEHTLNVAGFMIKALKRNRQDFMIPKAVVAALAHDFGKLPSIYMSEEMQGLSHPMRSAKALQALAGFDRLGARQEILTAVENHHRTGQSDGLVVMLRDADHGMREEEYAAVTKEAKGRKSHLYWQGPTTKEGRGGITKVPHQRLPEHPNEVPEDTLEGMLDPKYAQVRSWVQGSNLEEYDPTVIAREFAVGMARATVLFRTLVNQGVLQLTVQDDAPDVSAAAMPAQPAADHQPPGNDVTPAGRAGEGAPNCGPVTEGADDLYDPYALVGVPRTCTLVFEAPPEPPPSRSPANSHADISSWFELEPFVHRLRQRLNVDLSLPKTQGAGATVYFHGVTTRSGHAYFRVQCLKEIAAEQLRAAHQGRAADVLLKGEGPADQEIRKQIMLAVVHAFIDKGAVDPSYFQQGGYSVRCAVFTGATRHDNQHFVPFHAERFGAPHVLEGLKQGQPLVSQVLDIQPMAVVEKKDQEAAHG